MSRYISPIRNINPAMTEWYYKSGLGGVKGPFSATQMISWMKESPGLQRDLLIGVGPTGPFSELVHTFPNPVTAFAVTPASSKIYKADWKYTGLITVDRPMMDYMDRNVSGHAYDHRGLYGQTFNPTRVAAYRRHTLTRKKLPYQDDDLYGGSEEYRKRIKFITADVSDLRLISTGYNLRIDQEWTHDFKLWEIWTAQTAGGDETAFQRWKRMMTGV